MGIGFLKIAVGAMVTLTGIGAFVIDVVRKVSTTRRIAKPVPILPTLHILEWK